MTIRMNDLVVWAVRPAGIIYTQVLPKATPQFYELLDRYAAAGSSPRWSRSSFGAAL
jgi:hypothetical protein